MLVMKIISWLTRVRNLELFWSRADDDEFVTKEVFERCPTITKFTGLLIDIIFSVRNEDTMFDNVTT